MLPQMAERQNEQAPLRTIEEQMSLRLISPPVKDPLASVELLSMWRRCTHSQRVDLKPQVSLTCVNLTHACART